MAGVKGRSGRKKSIINALKDRLNRLETEDLPDIIDNLVTVARGGNVMCPGCGCDTGIAIDVDEKACEYLIDRILGKPKQSTDVSITEKIVLSADQALRILARAELQRQAFNGVSVIAKKPSDTALMVLPVSEDSTNKK